MLKSGKLIIVSGSAGSGKSIVLRELFNLAEYKYSVSATTRKPRTGEADGIDYYFLTREDFSGKIANGDMLEYIEYSGNFYGTPREPVEKMIREGYSVILEIEVTGALKVKEQFPEAVLIFLSPPTYAELERRLRERSAETEESIKKQLEISKEELENINKYGYFIINQTDGQRRAAFEIHCIAEVEKYRNVSRKELSRERELMLKTAEECRVDVKKLEKFLKNYYGGVYT